MNDTSSWNELVLPSLFLSQVSNLLSRLFSHIYHPSTVFVEVCVHSSINIGPKLVQPAPHEVSEATSSNWTIKSELCSTCLLPTTMVYVSPTYCEVIAKLTFNPQPPYVPTNATPGQHPNVRQDIAPSAVFLALYIASAVFHQVTFQKNRRRGYKFLMSWAMFGFSMARFGTMILRIAWSTRPNNGSVALAATIFAFLGVLVIYVVDLLLALRVFKARQPRLGWNPWLGKGIKITYAVLLVVVLVVVPFGIVSGFTKNPGLSNVCAWITKAGVLYFFLFNLIAPILYLLALVLPRPKDIEPENFGYGSMQAKLIILGVVLFFTQLISVFRFAVTWSPYRPLSDPGWYDTRAAFYIIQLGFELVVTFTLAFTRFDRRFWVPNGSSQHGDYSKVVLDASGRPENYSGIDLDGLGNKSTSKLRQDKGGSTAGSTTAGSTTAGSTEETL